ncbi:MAG: DNA repair protein RecO [Candidatus Izimaplasma sp.]|nr:DNA repair protein RecO [Candidatus Izimaplasma bacterium]
MEIIEGIILKQINYKESSKIIYLYTKNGLISVLVHGSNKLKSPYLNLVRVFSQVKLHVSGKNLKTLRDGEVINNNLEFTKDFDKYTYILHLTEIIYYFSGHDHDHEKLYLFLNKIFKQLRLTDDYIPFINMAELKLLYLLGVQPMLDKCVICGSTNNLTFSVEDGGLCCELHKENAVFQKETITLLKSLYYYDFNNPQPISYNKNSLMNLRLLIDEYYEYHLNYRSKSRKMLKELISY